ncbi:MULTISPECIES: cell division protein DedD [unclassified Pantoea]|uniref:cell division protein DedD n=1 Tax=unclassified Pantoea TaxID=2630326 RepID=UPI0005346934|nr:MULTISPECIES: cell division protein DedD [unclassified Pantoea]MDU6388534.1 cell division protein DedD [Pantoea sp.]
MASKFQNRLVGTIILVAVGVIVLPGLLDGKKKHYKEEFAAIPLVPKPDDQQDSEMVPPVTQPLPAQPPQGAGSAVSSSNSAAANPVAEQGNATPQSESEPSVVTPPPVHQNAPTKPRQVEQPKTRPAETPKAKPVEQPKAQPKPVESKPVETKQSEPAKPVETPKAAEQSAPAGQAYVVQLGALKNAAKVSEIVAKLRLSGYRAFTVPSTPVQGQITRIYVGPDASKAKLQSSLSELQSVSGLGGVVKPYSAR